MSRLWALHSWTIANTLLERVFAIVQILLCLSVSSTPAQMSRATLPAEVIDLCRTLRDKIINQAECLSEVPTDMVGMSRPAGGGCDIGALECDSGASDDPPPGKLVIRLEASPAAPSVCQEVRWTVTGTTDTIVGLRLYLRAAASGPSTRAFERTTETTSMACASIVHPPGERWLATLRAVDAAGQEVATSNEVELRFSAIATAPPPKPPPIVVLPPPIPRPIRPPVVLLPPEPPGTGRITDTDVWQGRGAVVPPAPSGSPGRLTETPTWRGEGSIRP